MVPLFADHDAWGLHHASRPLSHTQLGLVVETFLLCYFGLLLMLVTYTVVRSLWRCVTDPDRHKKPRTFRDERDPEFFD